MSALQGSCLVVQCNAVCLCACLQLLPVGHKTCKQEVYTLMRTKRKLQIVRVYYGQEQTQAQTEQQTSAETMAVQHLTTGINPTYFWNDLVSCLMTLVSSQDTHKQKTTCSCFQIHYSLAARNSSLAGGLSSVLICTHQCLKTVQPVSARRVSPEVP